MSINIQFFIYKFLKDSNKCKELGIIYDGETNLIRDDNHERCTKIEDRLMEQTIIADWMEVNTELGRTTDMLNQYRRDMGRDNIGRNAIMNQFRRLNSYITQIEKYYKVITKIVHGHWHVKIKLNNL